MEEDEDERSEEEKEEITLFAAPFFGKPIIPPLPPEGGSENESKEKTVNTDPYGR